MTLNDVPWDGASFDDPPYWGVRGIGGSMRGRTGA
jgi:hypothetical protein